jgi:hypothetical protein
MVVRLIWSTASIFDALERLVMTGKVQASVFGMGSGASSLDELGFSPVSFRTPLWRWFERQLQQAKPPLLMGAKLKSASGFLFLALRLRARGYVSSARVISVCALIRAARVSFSGRLLFEASVF